MSDAQSREPPPPIPTRVFQPTFDAGELAPSFYRRSDLAKWRSGAAILSNMIVTVQGGAARRNGTQYVATSPDTSGLARTMPFQFSTEQQYLIEVGQFYMRFVINGAYVMSGGSPYQISTPYAASDLATLQHVQSADVLTIVHPLYQPMELKRLGITSWTLTAITTGSALLAPTSVAAAGSISTAVPGSPAPATLNYLYAVTASSLANKDEGPLSASASCTNQDLGYYKQYGCLNTISWSAVVGADFYTIYRMYEGVWAKIGSTTALSFQDTNYIPDTTTGPPQGVNPFSGLNWPGSVGYFQERRVFGGSIALPETLEFSRSGNYKSFDVSNPVRDDDAITYTLAARQANQIRHIIPLTDMLIFTGGGGWRVNGGNGAVTPDNIDVAPQTFVGASQVDPLVIGNRILYVEAAGNSVREIAFQFIQNLYVSEDRSVFSKHLLLGHNIVSWAYAENPDKIVWAVREDGVLLSMTYLYEQQGTISAWARHSTQNGAYLWVTVIRETYQGITEDVPYFLVRRMIGGAAVTFIERMHTRQLGGSNADVQQAWHVDAALNYAGSPVTTVSGLGHLNGETVGYLADGVPGTAVVSGGAITLPVAASVIVVGEPMVSTFTTLPADSSQPMAEPLMGRLKHCYRCRLAVENATGLQGSVDGFALTDFTDPDNPADPPPLITGVLESRIAEGWGRNGQLTVTMATSLPATIVGVAMEWEVGE